MTEAFGKVYLIGAGPGDPGLLTVRGKECLERAGAVVYDNLASPELLEHAPRAEHIHVGKAPDRHTLLQDEINRVLLEQARHVNCVARLKGGDPFVFGRGGEEALFLAEHGVPFEIVPGVTAGLGAAVYAGIPITHRGVSGSVTLITGHDDPSQPGAAINLEAAAGQGTVIFYMAMKNLAAIAQELIRLGRSPETPAAVIQWGTLPRQQAARGALANIAERAAEAGLAAPAVVIIGEAVALGDRLSWFENRPLFNTRIVVTRSQNQAGSLTKMLRERGADVFEFPTIQIEPPEKPEDFGYIGDYDWIILTSVNGVAMLFDRLAAQGLDARDLHGVRLCVIGAATAAAVRERGLRIDCMPESYVAEALLEALLAHAPTVAGQRFLLPRADIARSYLPEELRRRGGEVTELVAYRTVAPDVSGERADALVAYRPHLLTFASSSTVRNLCNILGEDRLARIRECASAAVIGPLTRKAAEEHGFEVAVMPEIHDVPHFAEAIAAWARRRPGR